MAVTAKGYERIWHDGRARMEHDVIWEEAHGPIPEGLEVHHANEDKRDNRLENLELVDALTHKRLHSPHYRRAPDGSWERRCAACGAWKPATREHYYHGRRGWLQSPCRPCKIAQAVAAKQERRARAPG